MSAPARYTALSPVLVRAPVLPVEAYLALPRILQFFSGNIGFHHVHHYDPKIPNYNLQRAHEQEPVFQAVPALSLVDGLRAAQLKLYDEDTDRMVTWKQVRSAAR